MNESEAWRAIDGTDHRYSVSNFGRVRGASGHVLKPTLMRIGYYSVAISMRSRGVARHYVHRLVAHAFIGSLSPDSIVNHRNHDKLDNRLENLEVVNRQANARHWASARRSSSAGRKRTGYCGRGHQLIGARTYCLECRRKANASKVHSPPADTEWRVIPAQGYLISSDGRLWSQKFHRLLRPGINSPGYEYFNLRLEGRTKPFATHRLVAEAFLGEIGDMHVVDHINGNKRDNRVANLRIVSRSENTTAFRDRLRRENRHGFRIDNQTAGEIKWLLQNGSGSRASLAKRYGISRSLVNSIAQGTKWRHVGPIAPADSAGDLAPKTPPAG